MSEAVATKAGTEPKTQYRMTLFVAGDEANSAAAKANLNELCEAELEGRCHVEIVDILEDFQAAAKRGIVVTPTLLVHKPEPETQVIGNLSDRKKLRAALRLEERRS